MKGATQTAHPCCDWCAADASEEWTDADAGLAFCSENCAEAHHEALVAKSEDGALGI